MAMRILILVLGLACLSFASKKEPLRILAVGDSITQGGKRDRPEYTYRLPLQQLLRREGIAYDFIGSRQAGLHEDATWPEVAEGVPFDPDHEGYYGQKTAKVCAQVEAAFASYETIPDVVLIHLGTNDQKAEDHRAAVAEPLRAFITFLRQQNPEVIILLGHLNFHDSEGANRIRPLVEALAAEMDREGSPVRTVHHYHGWLENPQEVYTDTFDWAHPNLKGQEKMARHWWAVLEPLLRR